MKPIETDNRSEGDTSKPCHKKAVMVAKDVAGVIVFLYQPGCIAPLSLRVVWYQRETHSQACHVEAGF